MSKSAPRQQKARKPMSAEDHYEDVRAQILDAALPDVPFDG